MNRQRNKVEILKCQKSPHYFLNTYCKIYDATLKEWIPFVLWVEQVQVLNTIENEKQVIILKARQLGQTWLCLCYALWLMLFHPIATILLFSRRDTEAMYLLGNERIRGVYKRLPDFLKQRRIVEDSGHTWTFSNGSTAKAFPTSAGDSYTATFALVDEADLTPDLSRLLGAVKPTIDGGGQLVLLSRADKGKPGSVFKNIYREARAGRNGYTSIFLPWHIRPDRDQEWYDRVKQDFLSEDGSLDGLHEHYPATDTEALSPKTLDKRIPPAWLRKCYQETSVTERFLESAGSKPSIPNLIAYKTPSEGSEYVIGIDPAEGNPTSDDSALSVVDKLTGEEVAELSGKFQPSVLAQYADELGRWYNNAYLLPERNNHGHAVILWLQEHSKLEILRYTDGRPGWMSSSTGKSLLYSDCADTVKNEDCVIHSLDVFNQLASIEGGTLRAPEGERDDKADAFALAQKGRSIRPKWGRSKFVSV